MQKKTNILINPALPGYNPDPMLMKHGETFYMATSTFTSFPGVAIYASKNLINWKLVDTPLKTNDVLDLKGIMPGGGIYAPDLTYSNGKFYLVSVNVKNKPNGKSEGAFASVSFAEEIGGKWSKPQLISRKGIDQSFFHDDDGKSYFMTIEREGRWKVNVCIQEWDNTVNKLIGPVTVLWVGQQPQWTEAPHIFKAKGWYFLTVAEGGTEFAHQNTILRSKNLFGKYEASPYGALITSRYNNDLPIQRAGHASIVFDGDDIWVSHLGVRSFDNISFGGSPLGRESFIQRYKWTEDEWMINVYGGNQPKLEVEVPYEGVKQVLPPIKHSFSEMKELPIEFLSEKEQITNKWFNLTSKGAEIIGRHDMLSLESQSTINFRWLSSRFKTSVKTINNKEDGIEFGMNHRYDCWSQVNFFFRNKNGKQSINLKAFKKKEIVVDESIEITLNKEIEFISIVKDGFLKFGFRTDEKNLIFMKTNVPMDTLFDDFGQSQFVGSLFGIYVVDSKMKAKVIFKTMDLSYMDKWSVNKK